MTIEKMKELVCDLPIRYIQGWAENENHHIRMFLGETNFIRKPTNKENIDIDKVFKIIDDCVGFCFDENNEEDMITKKDFLSLLQSYLDENTFYSFLPEPYAILTFSGNNWYEAITTYFSNLPKDSGYSEFMLFSSGNNYLKAGEEAMRFFFTGHSFINLKINNEDDVIYGEVNDIRFYMSNGLFFDTSNFGLSIPSKKINFRYNFEKGFEIEKEYYDEDEDENENNQIETWSVETCRYTEDTLRDLNFGWDPRTGNVMMKKKGGGYGHIAMNDALKHIYRIVKEDGEIEEFYTVEELTKAGWALD